MNHTHALDISPYHQDVVGGAAAPSPSLLVSTSDLEQARRLELPISLIEVLQSQDEPTFRTDTGVELTLEQVALRAIGCLPLSVSARQDLLTTAAAWKDRTGVDAPAMLAVEEMDRPARRVAVLEWLVTRMAADRGVAATRSARHMRELGILRRQHEETQAGFRDLEAFLYRNVSQKRMLDITLSPVTAQPPAALVAGTQLVQRLPATSIGLSDVSIFIANETAPADGVLHASLSSPDTGQTLAIWEVPARKLTQGWLRLSLERALGPDAMTLMLTVGYQGSGEVRLSSSLQHPEERFRPRLDDQSVASVPALQIWRWIAGASAPLAATAILPIGGQNRLRRVLGETLTMARDLNNLQQRLGLQSGSSALLVHVLPDRLAGGILSGVALPGARHIYADVRTFHGDAQQIEYQIALAPRSARPHHSGELPAFAAHHVSDWVRMAPLEDGQVHLILPEPLDQPCDVYLMTRLPDGVHSDAFGWSTFANLTLQF